MVVASTQSFMKLSKWPLTENISRFPLIVVDLFSCFVILYGFSNGFDVCRRENADSVTRQSRSLRYGGVGSQKTGVI